MSYIGTSNNLESLSRETWYKKEWAFKRAMEKQAKYAGEKDYEYKVKLYPYDMPIGQAMAVCHPDKPMRAFGKCNLCYFADYREQERRKYAERQAEITNMRK